MHNELADNLFVLAKAIGLTHFVDGIETVNQSAVQDLTGVPQTTLSGIIKQGKTPRLDTLQKLARGLNVDLWRLLAPNAMLRASLEPGFAEMVVNYCRSSADGQHKIRLVAASQAVLAEENIDR